MTLTEFLLARIAEDEAVANETTGDQWAISGTIVTDHGSTYGTLVATRDGEFDLAEFEHADTDGAHAARHDPARVLAECRAKRDVVENAARYLNECDQSETLAAYTLTALAAAYATHPDYGKAEGKW